MKLTEHFHLSESVRLPTSAFRTRLPVCGMPGSSAPIAILTNSFWSAMPVVLTGFMSPVSGQVIVEWL